MAIIKEISIFLENYKRRILWKDVLMIGRQSNAIDKKTLEKQYPFLSGEGYCEKLWKYFWAEQVYSIDVSEYESPDFVHNMNYPIPQDLKNRFDIIFDGGSTEHMYHIPNALTNYKDFLRIWGIYIWVLPANNWCNHGFYQFSPDLFYRFFSKERGFRTQLYVLIKNDWYRIEDLETLWFPVHFNLFLGKKPALIYIVAEKIEEKQSEEYPLQTIYNMHLWNHTAEKNNSKIMPLLQKIVPKCFQEKFWQMKNQKIVLKKVKNPI